MKSIIEEASSIAKAIEKGWTRAGKPNEFTVKIFEQAEHNFLGMTTKPARISLFFEESAPSKERREQRPAQTHEQRERKQERPQHKEFKQQPKDAHSKQDNQRKRPEKMRMHEKRSEQRAQQPQKHTTTAPTEQHAAPQEKSSKRIAWTPEMIDVADLWMQGALKTLGAHTIQFASRVAGNSLRYSFSSPLMPDSDKERLLFSSFANLILATLRSKYKRDFRYLKVILNTNE